MFEIRKASSEDIVAVRDFQKQLHGDWYESSHGDLEAGVSTGRVWVATEAGNVIGYQLCELFGSSHKNFPDSIFLSELFVAPDHRKKGVGSLLIEAALNEDWPKEYVYFSLTHDPAEPHLTNYYERFGFKECGKTAAGNIKMIRQR